MFQTVKELKKSVFDACNGDISTENFGYIELGHGNRGKQQWLNSEEDLQDMYQAYHGKSEILLWAYRPRFYDKYLDKMTEVEMIEEELKAKHTQYSEEQIRSRAHLIQMKKHASYDHPPDKRFWKVAKHHQMVTHLLHLQVGVLLHLALLCLLHVCLEGKE